MPSGAACPRCATPRIGAFRFCLACRNDFDEPAGVEAQEAAPATDQPWLIVAPFDAPHPQMDSAEALAPGDRAAWAAEKPSVSAPVLVRSPGRSNSRWRTNQLIVAIFVLSVIGTFLASRVIVNGGVPVDLSGSQGQPQGTIWFGQAVDPTTHALSDPATAFGVGQPVALIANLSRPASDETLTIRTVSLGAEVEVGGVQVMSGDSAITYVIPGAFIASPGAQSFTIEDSSGNILASGSITAQ